MLGIITKPIHQSWFSRSLYIIFWLPAHKRHLWFAFTSPYLPSNPLSYLQKISSGIFATVVSQSRRWSGMQSSSACFWWESIFKVAKVRKTEAPREFVLASEQWVESTHGSFGGKSSKHHNGQYHRLRGTVVTHTRTHTHTHTHTHLPIAEKKSSTIWQNDQHAKLIPMNRKFSNKCVNHKCIHI